MKWQGKLEKAQKSIKDQRAVVQKAEKEEKKKPTAASSKKTAQEKGNLEKLIERYHKLKAAANSQVSSASQVLSTLIEPKGDKAHTDESQGLISPVSSASAFSRAGADAVRPAEAAPSWMAKLM